MLGEPEAVVEPPQRAGRPPVGVAGEAHERRHQRRADEEGVDEHGQREPDAEHLHERHLPGGEGEEHDGDQHRRGRDDPPGALQPDRHGRHRIRPAIVLFLDPRQEEHLVVHRQPEGDAEHQDRHRHGDVAGGGEVEQPGAVAVLEDEDHRPERRRQAEEVEDQRLDRHEQAAEQHEQHDERGDGDEPDRPRQPLEHDVLGVDLGGGLPTDEHLVERRVEVAHVVDERFAVGGQRLDGRHDGEPRAAVVGEAHRHRPRRGDLGAADVRAGQGVDPGDAVERRQLGGVVGDVGSAPTPSRRARARPPGSVAASPAAKSSRRMSCVSRTSAPGASTRSSGVPRRMPRNGAPSSSSRAIDGGRHGQRPAHHEHGDAVPDALAVDDRAALEHAALLDPMAEGGEHRRQQHDGAERRRRRHADAGVAERAHERDREHEHRRQPDRHRDGAEQDRPSGRAHGAHDGDSGLVAAGQLLADSGRR